MSPPIYIIDQCSHFLAQCAVYYQSHVTQLRNLETDFGFRIKRIQIILAQVSIAWVLRHKEMTSALSGASRVDHVERTIGALSNLNFSADELESIDTILE
jgi:aryl-alcohol dehydrogenase-like predicted oxidoreductase